MGVTYKRVVGGEGGWLDGLLISVDAGNQAACSV